MKKRFDLYSKLNQILLDASVFALAFIAAYAIRFEGWPAPRDLRQLVCWLPLLVLARLYVNYSRGIYQLVWRFVSLADALRIAKAIAVVTLGFLALRLLVPEHRVMTYWIKLPLSIIALEGLLSLMGSVAIRALRRIQYSSQRRSAAVSGRSPRRVLLYGAGRAGILLTKELEAGRDYEVVGFIDDDPQKVGSTISGTRVLGSGQNLPALAAKYKIEDVVISMATASRQTLARILTGCRRAGLSANVIPSLREILEENVPISRLRETHVEDVLGRNSVEVPGWDANVGSTYRGKRILVTGAGGSIGSELVRQLVRLDPARIAILDKDENSIYELEQELLLRRVRIHAEPQIADVRDAGRLRAIFSDFQPQIVFHAAAHKHVPLMERHPCEAVVNNVFGTKNVLAAAADFRAERFVFISSDKAVNPINVMGATKRIGELLVQDAAQTNGIRSACVRFGNVLGSRGSVLPLFQKQIAEGGPVTITHPDMTRYFMTIQEAVQLIVCAGTLAHRGEVFVLDMGQPRNILDLAREMILLSGLEPEKDIATSITGLRPGEKLMEELISSSETLGKTRFDKLSVIESRISTPSEAVVALESHLTRLLEAARRNEPYAIPAILSEMGLGFTTQPAKARSAFAAAE